MGQRTKQRVRLRCKKTCRRRNQISYSLLSRYEMELLTPKDMWLRTTCQRTNCAYLLHRGRIFFNFLIYSFPLVDSKKVLLHAKNSFIHIYTFSIFF